MHHAPVILKAFKFYQMSGFANESYRLIKNENNQAKIIPFQIDEYNHLGDFILDKSPNNENLIKGDGGFNGNDELVFMGHDMGSSEIPSIWHFEKPKFLFRIDAHIDKKNKNSKNLAKNKIIKSVFIAIYHDPKKRPPLSKKRYVDFNINTATINTSRYSYHFDPDNYLVIRKASLIAKNGTKKDFIKSSSFFLKSDFKYFLTFHVGHSDIASKLEAYKTGPIRTIVNVSFLYKILKLNFEMGMFTEVSFFSNSVILPTIMHNPLEGKKTLNKGSGFYYGFGIPKNMSLLRSSTNMPSYKKMNRFSALKSRSPVERIYKLSIDNKDFFMSVNIEPSSKMKENGNKVRYYLEGGDPLKILQRNWEKPLPLGESPVNLGVYFELSNFSAGEHIIGFQLIFENNISQKSRLMLQNIDKWYYTLKSLHKELNN